MTEFPAGTAAAILKLAEGHTASPVRTNCKPDARELMVRLAVHVLTDAADDTYVVLMFNQEKSVYLEAFIPPAQEDEEDGDGTVVPRPLGTVEYMVCNGLPGDRTEGVSHYTLAEAIAEFRSVVEPGWTGWREVNRAPDVLAPDPTETYGRIVEVVTDALKARHDLTVTSGHSDGCRVETSAGAEFVVLLESADVCNGEEGDGYPLSALKRYDDPPVLVTEHFDVLHACLVALRADPVTRAAVTDLTTDGDHKGSEAIFHVPLEGYLTLKVR